MTQALPEAESRQSSPGDHCDRLPFPSPESVSEDLPLSDELDLGSSEVLSDESDPGGALEPLLSPLWPEWSTKISNMASTSDESDSLSLSHRLRPLVTSVRNYCLVGANARDLLLQMNQRLQTICLICWNSQ
jgi:hypothetical protein